MNVMWMFGNGFDLRQGLKTSYRDFYASDYVQTNNTNRIYKEIKDNTETWADFELALGELSKRVPDLETAIGYGSAQFHTDVMQTYDELRSFIQDAAKKVKAPKDKYTLTLELDHCFTEAYRVRYHEWMDAATKSIGEKDYIDVEAATLNYTTNTRNPLATTPVFFPDSEYSRVQAKGSIFRKVHGDLTGIVVGCDNVSQFDTAVFDGLDFLILKETICDGLGNERMRFLTSINYTHLFLLFGLSLGATDGSYWRAIINRLANNSNTRAVIFDYRPAPAIEPHDHYRRRYYESDVAHNASSKVVTKRFLAYADSKIDKRKKERIEKEQILVAHKFEDLFVPSSNCVNTVSKMTAAPARAPELATA